MTPAEIREMLSNENPEALFADGFDTALVGIARQFTRSLALYDRAKCIAVLMGQGMDEEGAEEYFEFNVQDAWMGENTPCFATLG